MNLPVIDGSRDTSRPSNVTLTASRRNHAIVLALGALITLTVPAFLASLRAQFSPVLLVGAVGVLVLAVVALGLWARSDRNLRSDVLDGVDLMLYLSPVLLLTTVFPLAAPRMAEARVGDVSLMAVVMACSVSVPWVGQAACMPIYQALGELISERDPDQIKAAVVRHWAGLFLASVPLVAAFAVAVRLVTGWGPGPILVFIALLLAHVLFVQSLIVGNLLLRRGLWAVAWAAYAAALFLVPAVWWLPPVLGAATQIIPLGKHLKALVGAPLFLSARHLFTGMVRGLLTGAVLWADKLLVLLTLGLAGMPVVTIYFSLVPALIAYHYYFAILAPRIDAQVNDLHQAISKAPIHAATRRANRLFGEVDRSLLRTGVLGMILTMLSASAMAVIQPERVVLSTTLGVAAWLFVMVTLVSYQLDYLGETRVSQAVGIIHLVTLFLTIPNLSLSAAYLVIATVDLALLAFCVVLYRRLWRQPEYTLFWRRAVAW